ncbi:MAG: AraC family transcriptional regulator [Bacteroidota bacterium]
MKSSTSKLLIKNMVCQRCIMSVENILNDNNIAFSKVEMGEVYLQEKLTEAQSSQLEKALKNVGFELIETRVNNIIETIKRQVLQYIELGSDNETIRLSSYIIKTLAYDYSYLSDLFSSIEGKTIEQFFILQRMEKVKELLVYDQLSLTEIAYQTGFSSVHHLSAQFKKVTGFTPSYFKKVAADKRKALDKL